MQDEPQDKATTRRNRIFTAVAIGIGIVIGTVGGGPMAEWLHNDRMRKSVHFEEGMWREQSLNDITLQAPMELTPGQSAEEDMPEEIRKGVAAMQVFQAEQQGIFYIVASKIRYKASITGSLETEVKASMFHAAAAMGDENPLFEVKPLYLDGREGRRASYRRQLEGRIVRIDGIFVHDRQQYWSVKVIYVGDESAPAAARILDSVKIARSTI